MNNSRRELYTDLFNLNQRIKGAISIGNLETETIRTAVRKRKCLRYNKEKNDIQIFSKKYGDRKSERTVMVDLVLHINEETAHKLICCRKIIEFKSQSTLIQIKMKIVKPSETKLRKVQRKYKREDEVCVPARCTHLASSCTLEHHQNLG